MLRSISLSLLVGFALVSCGSIETPLDPGQKNPGPIDPGDPGGPTDPGNPGSTLGAAKYPTRDYTVDRHFSFNPNGNEAQVGQWSQLVENWPTLAIHTTLLPNGKVMTFGGNYYPDWEKYAGKPGVPYNNLIDVWDPATNAHDTVTYPGSAIFCGGHTVLPNGKLLVAGGDDLTKLKRHRSAEAGIRDANVYDYESKTWNKVTPMSELRWYPTTTVLPNGDVLAVGGNTTGSGTFAETPEVYDPEGNRWRRLDGARAQVDFYPWLFVASNGKVFNAGPDRDEVGWIDTAGSGNFTYDTPPNQMRRDYGTAVMYDQDKVLVIGGGGADERGNTNQSPTNTVLDIDISNGDAKYSNAQPMNRGRRFHTATLLADGSVLVTGGTSAFGFNNRKYPPNDPENGDKVGQLASVMEPELWNPATKTWTTMARMSKERLYHSTTLLLPDATVLVSGGGSCTYGNSAYSGCPEQLGDDSDEGFKNAQIFKPPYLFKGPRPSISSVPANIHYGATFDISTSDAANIAKVHLIRLGSVTHAFDMNQRINKLDVVSRGAGKVTVRAPANENLATPGHYMLFILNGNGVPSVARIVDLGRPGDTN